MPQRLILSDFVERELRLLRDECNFTDEELEFFNLRASGKSVTQTCFVMHIGESKATNLSKKIHTKISKVLAR